MLFDQLRFLVAELQLRFLFSISKNKDFLVNFLKMFFRNEHTERLNVMSDCFIVIRSNCRHL